MKEKGFTLIELLAVIVILAIIALIATPIILGIIKDTKKEADERSVEMYVSALKNAIVQQQLDGSKPIIGTFSTDNGKDILLNGEPVFTVDYDGPEITIDRIDIYEDGSVYIQGIKSKNDGKILADSVGIKQRYVDGEEVYYNVKTGKSCTNYHEENSKTGYNGINPTGNQTNCLKFYAFNDKGGKNLNLLLDHNTTATVAWNSTEDNSKGPSKETGFVLDKLYQDTNEWNVIIVPTNYEYKGTTISYTIDYNGYKARLITAQEVALITGADKKPLNWSETSENSHFYYLDGANSEDETWQTQVANSTNKSEYNWLFDRTNNCTTYGCNVNDASTHGYWTSSARITNPSSAWSVYVNGSITSSAGNYSVSYADCFGVRPVIEVLKSKLK